MRQDAPVSFARLNDRLRTGLWFLPSLLVSASVGLAVALPALDGRVEAPAITTDPDTARLLLATVATATVTFAGLVFSITIVALQLTSSQFSPRVLRQFLRDRQSQVALGVFAGVFLYDLLVLARVETGPEPFVPNLSVDVAMVSSAVAVFTFIGFVNHITQSIRVVRIIETVADETRRTARTVARSGADDPEPNDVLQPLMLVGTVVHQSIGAVLQDVGTTTLARVARDLDVVIRVVPEVGDYVPEGHPVLEAWSSRRETIELGCAVVDDALGFGPERTMTSDLAFGYRQLADIGAKALSPALNDPTTAVQCIDRLHDLLRTEAQRPDVARVHCDTAGDIRVVHPAIGWHELVNLSFDEIRMYGAGSLQVVRRIRAALEDLVTVAPSQYEPALREYFELLDRTVRRSFDDAVDRAHAGIADEQGLGDDGE